MGSGSVDDEDGASPPEYLRTALDRMEELFFVFDDGLRLREWNGTVESVTGYGGSELRSATPERFIPDGEMDTVYAAIDEVVETGDTTVEAAIETREGERIPYEFRASRLPLGGGESGFVGIGYDITERRRRERELKRRNDQLDRFASVVSHDLRNPLNVAQGRLALLREGHDGEHVAAIARAHDRMAALVDDLLALAHDRADLDVERLTLGELVGRCRDTVETDGVDLVVDGDTAVWADAGRLQQLLENLLRNAVEHGGETLRVGATADGFYVADDGPGIPPGERERVFDAGYTTTRDGTGLGLSIVADAADAHDWELRLTESQQGGARFEIAGARERPR